MGKPKNKLLNAIKKVCDFQKTDTYVYCVAALVFLSNVFSLDAIVFVPLLILLCITNLFSDDLKRALPVVMTIAFGVSPGNSPAKGDVSYYLSAPVLIVLITMVAAVIATAVYRVVKDKLYKNVNWKRGIGVGVVAYAASLALNGVFGGYYDLYTLLLGLLFAAMLVPFYFFFACALKPEDDNIGYICKVCVAACCLIVAELLVFYLTNYEFGELLDDGWKGKIHLGWGISNNIGIMISYMIPAFFYFVYKNQKGWLYYLFAALAFIAVYFTLSRDAMLFGAVAFGACSLACCLRGANKKFAIIATSVLGSAAVILIVLVFCGVFPDNMFSFILHAKFSDRGRFDIWRNSLYLFYENPVFGAGFTAYSQKYNSSFFLAFSHNTVVQIISSCGLLGFTCFLFHRLQTLKLMFYKLNSKRFFIVAQLICFILMGLFDIMFFAPYATIIYAVQLAALEKDSLKDSSFIATSF